MSIERVRDYFETQGISERILEFETVFPTCGSSNSAIEMTMEDLEKYSGFESWVDVCKLP